MARELTVSVDAMGGDAGPGIVITAMTRVVQRHPGVNFLLAGDETILNSLVTLVVMPGLAALVFRRAPP